MTLNGEQLEATFKRNIEFFKRVSPVLAEKFENYTPQAELLIDPLGRINIYDKRKEAYLYPGDGRLITTRQLAEWLKKPSFMTLATQNVKGRAEWLHTRYINRLIELRKKFFKESGLSLAGEKIPSLLVVGIGLGEHLKFLLKELPVENILLVEPNEDFFYISLHILDWQELLEPFMDGERKIFLLLGEDAKDIENTVAFFNQIGPFNAASTFIYVHYLDDFLKNYIKQISEEVVRNISFFGFFDDELISLKHTLQNIKNGVPLFNPYGKDLKPRMPAVVVGSGPSLDFLLPYLKKHRERLFVISCGTALAVLEKNNIVPDIHVNIERNDTPYKVAISTTSEDFRKEIPFLGANNNFPPFFEAFEKSAMFLKGGDAGSDLFPQKKLYFVNPTVTNTGLALAYYLGFDQVYLFGVDLAFHEKKHHAKGTAYETFFGKNIDEHFKGGIEVEGNFGETLTTNSIFYSSKRVMEQAIEYFSSQRKSFKVFNPNRGAKIEGAEPLPLNELEKRLSNLEERDEEYLKKYWEISVEPLRSEWFDFPKVKMQLMTNFFQLKEIMNNEISKLLEERDIFKKLSELYEYIRVIRKHNIIIYRLLHGTITQFLAHMYAGLLADAPIEKKKEYLRKTTGLFKEMLDEMEREIYNLYSYFPI